LKPTGKITLMIIQKNKKMEHRAINIWFDPQRIYAEFTDGRVVGMPLAWFQRLEKANEYPKKTI